MSGGVDAIRILDQPRLDRLGGQVGLLAADSWHYGHGCGRGCRRESRSVTHVNSGRGCLTTAHAPSRNPLGRTGRRRPVLHACLKPKCHCLWRCSRSRLRQPKSLTRSVVDCRSPQLVRLTPTALSHQRLIAMRPSLPPARVVSSAKRNRCPHQGAAESTTSDRSMVSGHFQSQRHRDRMRGLSNLAVGAA